MVLHRARAIAGRMTTGFLGMTAVRRVVILGALALGAAVFPAPAAAQVGHPPGASPYRDIRKGHTVTGGVHTAHTTNPVPFVAVRAATETLRAGGSLRDVAPTVLQLLGIDQPVEMTGRSLTLS